MSLQVWLPFTDGTLKQQGLSNAIATTGGTVGLTDVGKLGKCATIGTATGGITLPASTMTSFTECSVAFWIKIISWNTSYATFFQAGLGSTPWNNYIFGILRNNANSNLCFTLTNSSGSSTNASYVSSNLEIGQWYHLAFTYKAGTIYIYKDGVLDKTYSTTYVPNFAGITHISIGRCTNNSNYQTNCNLNDFRIYDHCLSPMEVKQLSQGLVLHYPLSDEYIESTTNLVTTEDGLSNTCYNGATSKYGYGTNTDMYKTLGVFEGRKSTKVYMGTAGLSAYPYVYFDNFNASGTTIQTLSFDYYSTIQNTLIPYSYNGSYNFSYTTDKTSGSANNVSQITIPVEVGKWNHITVTAQKADTTNTSRGIGYIRIGSTSHTSTTSNYWLFSNVQVEAKDHATGYAGVGGTRNSTIVYDCSGFCNNGTISGALTISNDTPKYTVSTQFTGTQFITADSPTFEGATLALWAKTTSTSNAALVIDYKSKLGFGFWSGVIIPSCNSNIKTTYSTTNYIINQWNHIVVVRNSSSTLQLYINGVLQTNTASAQDYWSGGVIDGLSIAARPNGSSPISCQVSDVRIYATALSADDVKSLYQNSAYIDSSGNVYGAVH